MSHKVAILAVTSPTGEVGGAERFYVGLRDALCNLGVDAEILWTPSHESDFQTILRSYLRFYDLDLSDFDGIISTKAPGYVVRHPNHVCYLQHTMRVFYDMFEAEFPWADDALRDQRKRVQELDTAALSSRNIRRLFVVGEEVGQRLLEFNGIESEVLYQATTLNGFQQGEFDYLFMPGRLHRWKRVDLVIRALARSKAPVKLLISGTGDDEAGIREQAEGDERIMFLGRISDDELLRHYANALAVPFVPYREDFGLVAIEAFHSGKPVITCNDSGEPARITSRFEAGVICEPTPDGVGAAIEGLFEAPETARRLGANGRLKVAEMSWEATAKTLIKALGFNLHSISSPAIAVRN